MFIPDPNLLNPGSRIQGQKYPGSQIRIRIKEFKYLFLTQKCVSKLSEIWSGIFIPDPDLDFLPIPDPGFKKAQDPGSGSATLVIRAGNRSYSSKRVTGRPNSTRSSQSIFFFSMSFTIPRWDSLFIEAQMYEIIIIKYLACEMGG